MLTWYNSVRQLTLDATYYDADDSVDCTAFSQDMQTLIKYYVYSYRNVEGYYFESAGIVVVLLEKVFFALKIR